jgi:hypothetical protein
VFPINALPDSELDPTDGMEGVALPSPPSNAIAARLRQQQLMQRDQAAKRSPTSQVTRDGRFRRSPPKLGRTMDKIPAPPTTVMPIGLGKSKAPLSPAPSLTASPRSLVPAAERKSQEDTTPSRKPRKVSREDDKWEIAPDGTSAGREGRQFTVSNVGNNGRIYLR